MLKKLQIDEELAVSRAAVSSPKHKRLPFFSVYVLKPRFQIALAPFVRTCAKFGVTANQITVFACMVSTTFGILLALRPQSRFLLLSLPVVLLLRMALNAMDGILAREFSKKSLLGIYLNELGDVISDAALYLPFVRLRGFDSAWMMAVVLLAVISEMAGVLGVMAGASRRYDGPMGKSDRAVVFGALALWSGLGWSLSPWFLNWFPPILCVLLAATVIHRVRNGLAEKGDRVWSL